MNYDSMTHTNIQASTLAAESDLLDLSQRILKVGQVDTLNGWIVRVIREEPKLARYLHFPADNACRDALLTLVERQSLLNTPIIHLLAERISVFVAHLRDVHSHAMRGPTLESLVDNVKPMEALLRNYRQRFARPKKIPLVLEAINNHRLHLYKERPGEPDLRVALRAFYEDTDRSNEAANKGILDFVFDILKRETGSHLSQPRHVWWALLTLFREADEEWLHQRRKPLAVIIRHWLSLEHYAPRADRDFTTVTPELDSITNERAWVTINAMRLVLLGIETVFSPRLMARIHGLIQANLAVALSESQEESMKHLTSRQILLYDAVLYSNRIRALELANSRTINLRTHRIGKFFYDESVSKKFSEISRAAEGFISKPASWIKRTLSSILISGSAGQGKSELALQLSAEFSKIAKRHKRDFVQIRYSIGTEVKSSEELGAALKEMSKAPDSNVVQVIIFDEFDKAKFDFFTPFLPFLEDQTSRNGAISFFLFAQSTYPTRDIFASFAEKSEGKATRDFLTRLQLGAIDLPDIRISPEQRLMTVLGMAKNSRSDVTRISRECVLYFSLQDNLRSNRDLMSAYTNATYFQEEDLLSLKAGVLPESVTFGSLLPKKKSEWITLEV